ncbi:MAG TPA: winged helix-turn-helix domain-containing protein [Xanthomonadales bacterium]|nr:winged helix-turn-helix domain-containing protein [Xanthomonadales bacterium]
MTSSPLRIGEWRFHAASFELERERDGARQRLPHRLGRLLARLAATPGEVVTREELIAAAWDRRGVADEVLSRSVNALRDALGDSARAPRYIETIPKRGYRLVAAVQHAAHEPASDAHPPAARPRGGGARRVAAALGIAAAALVAVAHLFRPSPREDAPQARQSLPSLDLGAERPLTSRPGWELGPALSGDGRLLAYTEVDGPSGPSRLVVGELDGAGRHVLFENAGATSARPAFAPAGTELAYRRDAPDGCRIVVAAVVTGEARVVAPCAPVNGGIDWSPDGELLAYTAPAVQGKAPGLAIASTEDGSVLTLTTPSLAQGPDVDPRFVPGARRVSFARGEGSDRALYTVALDPPHAVEPLFPGANLIHGHAWRPDGSALVLATDAPGYRALLAFAPASGEQSVLGARGARFPALGGGMVVYELANYDANVWRVELDGTAGAPRRLTTSARYDASPEVSPDGTRFAFASVRDGLDSVWIGSSERAEETRLPLARDTRWVRPHWHPDGESLLVTAYAQGATQVHRHLLASGRTQPLAALGEAFGAADTPDGRAIVFARRDTRGYTLWLAETGAAPRALERATGVDEFHVGDGFVAYTRLDAPGVVLHELASGARRVVLERELGRHNRFDWTVRGASVYYAAPADGGAARLYRYDPRDGAVADLAAAQPDAVGATVSVSPDARYALFARVDELTVDLMGVPLR